jgi:hypothetical protein
MKNILLTLLAGCALAGACNPKCPPDRNLPPDVIDSSLNFALVHRRTGQPYFPLFANPQGISISDEKGRNYPFAFEVLTFQMGDFLLKTPEDLAGLDGKTNKTFYLRLSATDTDTIRYVYRLRINDCKEPEIDFSAVQVWFNGQQAEISSTARGYVFYK